MAGWQLRAEKLTTRNAPSGYLRLMVFACTLCSLAGCVGRNEALQLAETLTTQSKVIGDHVGQLEDISKQQAQAHIATRQALRDSMGETHDSRLKLATERMRLKYHNTLLKVDEEYVKLLSGMAMIRQSASKQFDDKLTKELLPLISKAESLKTTRATAVSKAKQFPDDKDLRDAADKARSDYWVTMAALLDIQFGAMQSVSEEFDQALIQHAADLTVVREKHRNTLKQVFDDSVAQLRESAYEPPDLGPEPESGEAMYQSLKKYVEAVSMTGEAYRNFLQANWFGKNSFFSDFIRSLGSGFAGAIVKPEDGGVNFSQVKQAAQPLIGAFGLNFQQRLNTAENTAREALRETAASLTGKLDQEADKAADDAAKKSEKLNPTSEDEPA